MNMRRLKVCIHSDYGKHLKWNLMPLQLVALDQDGSTQLNMTIDFRLLG